MFKNCLKTDFFRKKTKKSTKILEKRVLLTEFQTKYKAGDFLVPFIVFGDRVSHPQFVDYFVPGAHLRELVVKNTM